MYGDTQQMRRYAAALREQGTDVRLLADQLVARTEAIGWVGRAADSMRERVRDRASQLRAAAARHETAAVTLERHLAEVDRLTEAVATRERKGRRLVEEARARGRSVGDPDPDDLALVALTLPAVGHRDWLTLEIPGL